MEGLRSSFFFLLSLPPALAEGTAEAGRERAGLGLADGAAAAFDAELAVPTFFFAEVTRGVEGAAAAAGAAAAGDAAAVPRAEAGRKAGVVLSVTGTLRTRPGLAAAGEAAAAAAVPEGFSVFFATAGSSPSAAVALGLIDLSLLAVRTVAVEGLAAPTTRSFDAERGVAAAAAGESRVVERPTRLVEDPSAAAAAGAAEEGRTRAVAVPGRDAAGAAEAAAAGLATSFFFADVTRGVAAAAEEEEDAADAVAAFFAGAAAVVSASAGFGMRLLVAPAVVLTALGAFSFDLGAAAAAGVAAALRGVGCAADMSGARLICARE